QSNGFDMYRRPCGNLSPWITIPPVPDLLIRQTGIRRFLSDERGIKHDLVFSNVNSRKYQINASRRM
ncbi:hypothetical protein, partial [Ileibacterium valens]|uniref:hypothetical protein n=1 Tax=Ileibacterium valens TaxID=1862668 RepID=UPI00259BD24B